MQVNKNGSFLSFLTIAHNTQQYLLMTMFLVSLTVGSFISGLWALVAIGGSAVITTISLLIEREKLRPDLALFLLSIAVLTTMGLLNIESIRFDLSWKTWVNLITTFIPLCFLLNHRQVKQIYHPSIFIIISTAFLLGTLGLGFELLLGGPILKSIKGPEASLSEYNRGVSYLVIISFPIMAYIYRSAFRWFVMPITILLLLPASLTDSRASKLALLLGVTVIVFSSIWPRQVKKTLQGMVVLLLSWPFIINLFYPNLGTFKTIPNSWQARLEIWDYMSYRIFEHPWLGWGLGTSSILPVNNPYSADYVFTHVSAGHPHNVITQLWVELGLPGIIVGLVFSIFILNRISRMDQRIIVFAYGAWTAAVCLACVAYNFWTDSFFSVCAMTGVVFSLLSYHLKSLDASIGGWSSKRDPDDS